MTEKAREPLARLVYIESAEGVWIPFPQPIYITQKIRTTPRMPFVFGAAETAKSYIFTLEGIVLSILYEQYDTTNDATGTVSITNMDAATLFSKASLADATATLISVRLGESLDVPLVNERHTCTVTLSGAPGNAGICYTTIYVV